MEQELANAGIELPLCGKEGLTSTEAEAISNLANQEIENIKSKLAVYNNCSKTLNLNGTAYLYVTGRPVVNAEVESLLEAQISATKAQAYLRQAVKDKNRAMDLIRNAEFLFSRPQPEEPDYEEEPFVIEVTEADVPAEKNSYIAYLLAEAEASVIGKFIHKDGKLDVLRRELPTIQPLEFIELENTKKSPVIVTVHNSSDDLLKLHNSLAGIHRKAEREVNRIRAANKERIYKLNQEQYANIQIQISAVKERNNSLRSAYEEVYQEWVSASNSAREAFYAKRIALLNYVANLKIEVPSQLQDVINRYQTMLQK